MRKPQQTVMPHYHETRQPFNRDWSEHFKRLKQAVAQAFDRQPKERRAK